MRLSIHRGGYPYTSGRVNGRQVCIYAHRAVALAWIGPPPSEGMQVCHNDSDPRNTHVKNLRWDTPYGNTQDTVRAGRMNGGRPHGS